MGDETWIEKLADWSWRRQQKILTQDSLMFGVLVLVGILGFYIGGPIFLGWFIWKQIKLEKSYLDRYGYNWQVEYEIYHGSLFQAHLKITVCVVALLSIMAVGYWFYRQTRRGKGRRSRG